MTTAESDGPSFVDRVRSRALGLWRTLKNEHSTPKDVAWAVGIGVYAGCTPAVGFHGWVAVGLAALCRKNKLWAWVGSRISNIFFLPWIILAEIQIAHRVRAGRWLALSVDEVRAAGPAMLLDWLLGSVAVGLTLGLVLGLATYAFTTWRGSIKRGKLAPPPPPSSESPASG